MYIALQLLHCLNVKWCHIYWNFFWWNFYYIMVQFKFRLYILFNHMYVIFYSNICNTRIRIKTKQVKVCKKCHRPHNMAKHGIMTRLLVVSHSSDIAIKITITVSCICKISHLQPVTPSVCDS